MHRGVALAVLLFSLTTTARSEAIRGGVLDHVTDAVLLTSPGKGLCTGVAISEDVVLTAAHCFAEDLAAGCATPYPITRAAPEIAPGTRVFLTDAHDAPRAIEVVEIVGLDGVDILCGHDIVALRVARPLDVTPLVPRLDRAPAIGEGVSVVGFGEHEPHDKSSTGVRRRRDDARITELGRGTSIARGRSTRRDFVVDEGACSGDSGGPALDRSGKILGLMSRGDVDSCSEVTYTRLDHHAVWLRAVVTRSAAERGVDPPSWAVAPLARPEEPAQEEPSAPPIEEASCAMGTTSRAPSSVVALAFALVFGLVSARRARRG